MTEDQDKTSMLKLKFEEDQSASTVTDDFIQNQALANIRERKKMQKQSKIFDGSEKKGARPQQEKAVETEIEDQIDLTAQQEEAQTELITEIDNDLDLLEATIDPMDVKSARRKARILEEIEHEKTSIKVKYLFRYGRSENDPFRLWS